MNYDPDDYEPRDDRNSMFALVPIVLVVLGLVAAMVIYFLRGDLQ